MFTKTLNLLTVPLFLDFQKKVDDAEKTCNLSKKESGILYSIGAYFIYFLHTDSFSLNSQSIKNFFFGVLKVKQSYFDQVIHLLFECQNLNKDTKQILLSFLQAPLVPDAAHQDVSMPVLHPIEHSLIEHDSTINARVKEPKLEVFYVYRITAKEELQSLVDTGEKRFYYGYRKTKLVPHEDQDYMGSNFDIKQIIKKHGRFYFKKKILGVYVACSHALKKEIFLHKKFDVKNHPLFFNLSNQTSLKFSFDNTGRISTAEANQKRSLAQLNKPKHTTESKAKISVAQKNRKRPEEETAVRSAHAQHLNKARVICPHCGKKVQWVAGQRWHFQNCLKNPAVSSETLKEREILRQKAISRNKKSGNKK